MRLLTASRLTVISALILIPLQAHATAFLRWENRRETAGGLRLIPEIQRLSTSSNYDAGGNSTPVEGLSYTRLHTDLTVVYGLNSRASTFARVSLANVSYEAPGLQGSGFGLGDQAVGFNYRAYRFLDLQIQFDVPFYDKADARRGTPKDPLLGEGSFDVTVGPFLTLPLHQSAKSQSFLLGTVGLRERSGAFSSGIPYQASWLRTPTEASGLLIRVGLSGYRSLSSDQNDVTLDPGAIPQDAGGSLIVNAVNPSYLSFRGMLGYQLEPSRQVYLAAEKTLAGSSTADLFAVHVGAQFRFGTAVSRSEPGTSNSSRVEYDLEASVVQTNDRLNLVKINRGSGDGIKAGQSFDIYSRRDDGFPGDLIARGVVTDVRDRESALEIRQYLKQVVIQPGFPAKRSVK